MINCKRNFLIFFCVCIVVLSCTLCQGRQVWTQGTVTKAPWKNKHSYIKVDSRKYTFMPNAALVKRYSDYDETFHEKSVRYNKIRKGQKVLIRAEGCRIYQLKILD